jgi:hypothetical protein
VTPAEAEALAARTLHAIPTLAVTTRMAAQHNENARRVQSDLLGLREVWAYWRTNGLDGDPTDHSHGRRYAECLKRTAALYGVTPTRLEEQP